jgi:hypothetical protein
MTFPVARKIIRLPLNFPAGADMDIMALLAAMTGGDEAERQRPCRTV